LLEELSADDIALLRAMSGWGRISTRDLMSVVGLKRTKFYNCINRLVRLGLVDRIMAGEYRLTDRGRVLAEKLVDLREVPRILEGDGEPLRLKLSDSEVEVRNLSGLKKFVGQVESEHLYQLVRASTISRWLYAIGDRYLSREVGKLRAVITRSDVKERLRELIEERVSFLERLASLAASTRKGKSEKQETYSNREGPSST
jgi:predicted transcriptional regulator